MKSGIVNRYLLEVDTQVWRMTAFRYIGWSLSGFSFILFLPSKPFAIFLNEFGTHTGDKLITCLFDSVCKDQA